MLLAGFIACRNCNPPLPSFARNGQRAKGERISDVGVEWLVSHDVMSETTRYVTSAVSEMSAGQYSGADFFSKVEPPTVRYLKYRLTTAR
ncbi:MAG: hypothetical protein QOF48_3753 [Verrucomicrobiota bacterium]